jgi:hypothetical protein
MDKQPLSYSDFILAGDENDIHPAVINAVAKVESLNSGFFSNGDPVILFEAHIFSRLTSRKYDKTHPSISSRKWNRKLYKGGVKEYLRLEEAKQLNEEAALKSCSWGKFQIMGFNWNLCGYLSIHHMVEMQYLSEKEHLDAFIEYCKKRNLIRFLKDPPNFGSFAYYYNGPGYKQNSYDTKMRNEYLKFLVIYTPKFIQENRIK